MGNDGLNRARWLAFATDLLEGLLNASEPHQLEAFHAYRIKRDDVSLADVAAVRQLLLTLVGTLDGSEPQHWQHIALALDAFLPEEPPVASPLAAGTVMDHTQQSPGIARAMAIPTMRSDGAQAPGSTLASPLPGIETTQASPGVSGLVDSTMAAHAPPAPHVIVDQSSIHITSAGPASTAPVSVDETVTLGELRNLDLDEPAADQAPASMSERQTTATTPTPNAILDIDKYAVLCAWTELQPERRQALHDQYGLRTEDDRRALDQHFEQLFVKDVKLRTAFAQRLRMHMKFLRAGALT
jgi:hypothetical protein